MRRITLPLLALLALGCGASSALANMYKDVTELQIEVTFKPVGCDDTRKAKVDDIIYTHYTGYLTDGVVFDTSHATNRLPIMFKVGAEQVIKGWDQGVIGACVGEKRRLHIPPHLGYGDTGVDRRIPGGATLIADIEVMALLDDLPDDQKTHMTMGDKPPS